MSGRWEHRMDLFLRSTNSDPDIFAVRGEVDLATLHSLPRSFRTWLRGRPGPPSRPAALDLEQVTFVDCAGLRGLLAIERHAEQLGGGVTLAATSPEVTRLLDLVALPAGSTFRTRQTTKDGALTGPRTDASALSRAART